MTGALPFLALAVAAGRLAPGHPLTLDEVLQGARVHSTEIRMAGEALKAAKSRIGQQDASRKPKVDLSGQATVLDDRTVVDMGGGPIEMAPNHNESLEIALTQILDVTGILGQAVAVARLQALESEYSLATVQEDMDLAATSAYYSLLRATENVKVAKAALDAYTKLLDVNTKLHQGGIGQKIDVLRAKSQVSAAEGELTRRENDRRAAQSRLNDLVGRPLDEETQLEEVHPASAVAEAQIPGDPAPLIVQALDKRTEILASEVGVKAAQKGLRLAQSSNLPQFALGLGGTWYPTTSFQLPRSTIGSLTLSATFPIGDGGLARAKVKEAKAGIETAKASQEQVRRGVALQVQNAALDVQTAWKRLEAARSSLTEAQAARDLAQQRYEAQVSIYLEVTDAQAALTQAQAAEVEAAYDFLTAKARLARALGEPLLRSQK